MTTLQAVLTALTFFILTAKTPLYNSALEPIVELPVGYFVMQNDGDAPDGYIAVVYDDLKGYVKSDGVKAVDYTPVNKYETTVTFKCDNDGQPVNMRAAPRASAEIVTVLAADASGRCYGSIPGDALINGSGNTWYYVRTEQYAGYCYYAHVTVGATPPNVIEKETPVVVEPVEPEPQDPPTTSTTPQTMSSTAAVTFIVALCIPVPFIMFYLFKKPKDDK